MNRPIIAVIIALLGVAAVGTMAYVLTRPDPYAACEGASRAENGLVSCQQAVDEALRIVPRGNPRAASVELIMGSTLWAEQGHRNVWRIDIRHADGFSCDGVFIDAETGKYFAFANGSCGEGE